LRQAKRAQQRLVDPGQLSANTLIARTQGVEVTAMMSLSGNVKGGSLRDLPLTTELSDSLGGWFAFLESVKGVRLRRGGS
jgi:hypothetical protein